MDELKKWKMDSGRKPLILNGARQVGKTYILQQFGRENYKNLAYFNFDHDELLKDLFKDTKEPRRIIEQLSFVYGRKIFPKDTLIFFDEIQECPDALNSLKYFYEEIPDYHIVAAGSLLGVKFSHTSFPVGKVNFLDLMPMSFSEFLIADGCQNLVDFMRQISRIEEIPEIFAKQLSEKLRTYFIIGGMPEAVKAWTQSKDILKVEKIQTEILRSYESDFSKHVSQSEANKISLIWNSIPSQLSRENKKFVYQALKTGARAREYEDALNWLRDAGLIYKISNTKKPAFPLKAYEDLTAFKIYMLDVGLLGRFSGLSSKIVLRGDEMFAEFKGALVENYILQTLKLQFPYVYYFTFDRYEVDFLVQIRDGIFPIEVKSGARGAHASLTKYVDRYMTKAISDQGILDESFLGNDRGETGVAIRFSVNNLKKDGAILNIPLYLAEYVERII